MVKLISEKYISILFDDNRIRVGKFFNWLDITDSIDYVHLVEFSVGGDKVCVCPGGASNVASALFGGLGAEMAKTALNGTRRNAIFDIYLYDGNYVRVITDNIKVTYLLLDRIEEGRKYYVKPGARLL